MERSGEEGDVSISALMLLPWVTHPTGHRYQIDYLDRGTGSQDRAWAVDAIVSIQVVFNI